MVSLPGNNTGFDLLTMASRFENGLSNLATMASRFENGLNNLSTTASRFESGLSGFLATVSRFESGLSNVLAILQPRNNANVHLSPMLYLPTNTTPSTTAALPDDNANTFPSAMVSGTPARIDGCGNPLYPGDSVGFKKGPETFTEKSPETSTEKSPEKGSKKNTKSRSEGGVGGETARGFDWGAGKGPEGGSGGSGGLCLAFTVSIPGPTLDLASSWVPKPLSPLLGGCPLSAKVESALFKPQPWWRGVQLVAGLRALVVSALCLFSKYMVVSKSGGLPQVPTRAVDAPIDPAPAADTLPLVDSYFLDSSLGLGDCLGCPEAAIAQHVGFGLIDCLLWL